MPEETEPSLAAVPFNPDSLKKGESYQLNETPDGKYKVGQVVYTANGDHPVCNEIGDIRWVFPTHSDDREIQIGLKRTGSSQMFYLSLEALEKDGLRVVDARFTAIGDPEWLDEADAEEQQIASDEERRAHRLVALKRFYLETVQDVPDNQGLRRILAYVGILDFTEPDGLAWIDYTWNNWKALSNRELYQAKPVLQLIEELKSDKLFAVARARAVQVYGEASDEIENELITLGFIFSESINHAFYRDKRPSKQQAEELVALLRSRDSRQANSMADQLEKHLKTFQDLTAYS